MASGEAIDGKVKPGYSTDDVEREIQDGTLIPIGDSDGTGGGDNGTIVVDPVPLPSTLSTEPVIRKRIVKVLNGKIVDQRIVYMQKYGSDDGSGDDHAGSDFYRFVVWDDTQTPPGTGSAWIPTKLSFTSDNIEPIPHGSE